MDKPLVTVAIIAYKAADYIIETLESVKNQTYQNIELIVSDDHSPDDTVAIARQWLSENGNRFVRTELITVEQNTGVTGNCNRALAAARGYYYEDLAGDDVMMPENVEKFVSFFQSKPEVQFAFGKSIYFYGDFCEKDYHPQKFSFKTLCMRESVTAQQQYHYYQKIYFANSAGYFTRPEVLKSVGGYDERFPLMEDDPMYVSLTKSGVKLWLMDEFVVYKRQHDGSIMHIRDSNTLLSNVEIRLLTTKQWYDTELAIHNLYLDSARKFRRWLGNNVLKAGNDKRSLKCRLLNYMKGALNPFRWFYIWAIIKEKCLVIMGVK